MKKTILITGCSSGFGLLSALQLAKKNHVIATMRNLTKKDPLETQYTQSKQSIDTGSLTILPLDVTQTETITSCITAIMDQFNRIDILINNAGYALGSFFEDLSEKNIKDQLETNLFGVMNMTRAVLPIMRQQNKGRIIMISSIAGYTASPGLNAYNTSKFALEGFSESLLFEVAPFNIDVILIQPGVFKTDIFTKNLKLGDRCHDPNSPYYTLSQQLLKKLEQKLSKSNQNPNKVISVIKKAVHAHSPRFRYIVGKDAKFRHFLKRWLPFRLYKKLILCFFRQAVTVK
jgi:NAD(P)-dependent dehydrogenase (short-subunit alcohol dehydrogenase family)